MLASVTDARNHTTTYWYNSGYSPAYLTTICDALNHTTNFTYDPTGNRTSVTDARGNTTYYSYDSDGRVTQITNPDNTTRTFTYNCCNLTSATDENGKTTTYHYDNAERLSYVTDAENHETHYAYDNAGNLTSVSDANNHATSYIYDEDNRLTRIDYPDSTCETFAYYDTGALETRTDGNGVTTTYTRDELDRVTAIDYPGTASDVTFTYDAKGRVTRMQDGNCDTYYLYDSYSGITVYDQLIAVQRKYGTMTSYRTTLYNYDQDYNRTTMSDGEGNGTSYAYDADNRLTQITRGPYLTTFAYDNAGNRTTKTLPNGAYTTYAYNNRNWLTTLGNYKSDATLVSSYAYGYDYAGNRTSMTEANGDVTSYLYDNVYRLTDETKRDSGDNVLYRYQYTYDGVGNRLTENNAGVISYTYDANNKLTQLVGPSGTTTFGYDNNGNTTSMVQPGPVTTTYGYDYENRLTSVTKPSYTANYTYAADGLRLRIQESNAQYTDRWLQYDGVRPVLEGTLDSYGNFTTLNKYVWEGNSYYDPLMYSLIGGSWRYHMYDGLGSTRQLMLHVNPYTVTDTYSYEAFGNLMSSTGTTANPYKYVGSLGYYQTGNGLMHLGARYYMPEVGRFAGADPIWGMLQRYAYVANQPLNYVDPEGLNLFGLPFMGPIYLLPPITQKDRELLACIFLWPLMMAGCGGTKIDRGENGATITDPKQGKPIPGCPNGDPTAYCGSCHKFKSDHTSGPVPITGQPQQPKR
jgi:RHS repeat-associated protein